MIITSRAWRELIYQDLNPNLKVYVEYSNETWNGSFQQYNQVQSAAARNPVTTVKSGLYAVAQQSAFQTRYIGDVFKSVFGAESSRVLPVLGAFTWSPYSKAELSFLQQTYGQVSNSIAAFAIAPYVNMMPNTDKKGLTVTGLSNSYEEYLNTAVAEDLISNEALAKTYGVPLYAYEGGGGFYNSTKNPSLGAEFDNSPLMYTLYRNLMTQWNLDVGGNYTFYALNDSFWGLLPSVNSTGSQKWDAVMSFLLPAGDTDLDGKVTTADIQTIEANMGKTKSYWDNGDFTDSGVVTPQDLAMAEANLPATPAAATYIAQDTTTQGHWKGVYGSDGYDIIGDTSSLPVYATVAASNVSTQVWNSNTTDPRGLVKANSNATDNIAADWYSKSGSFTVDIGLPDGLSHVVTLYADDWNNLGRTEQVQVIDPSTGNVLDTRTISSFSGGLYLSWQLTGNVELKFTGLNGTSPVLNGIFFDHVGSQSFVAANRGVQGNWQGIYGAQGYDFFGSSVSSLPAYAQISTTNATSYIWDSNTTDPRGLEVPGSGISRRIASAMYGRNGSFTVNLDLTDGLTHQVSIYVADWLNRGRSERVQLVDPANGQVLDSRVIPSYSGGEYLTWKMTGNVELVFTGLSGPNPIVNGIFFDQANQGSAAATFISSDTTTQGNWEGTYGTEGYDLMEAASSVPSYARITTTNTSSYVTEASTTDSRGLQVPGRSSRVAAMWENQSGSSFTVDIDLTDGLSHDVSIYAVDWNNLGRSEEVQVIDQTTGTVLDTRTISSFANGEYLTWRLSGNVELKFTSLSGPNAVLNGIFFGQSNAATFVSSDTTTQGSWKGVYGADGYSIVGDLTSLPSDAFMTTSGTNHNNQFISTDFKSALQRAEPGATYRDGAFWYGKGPFTVNVSFNDGLEHELSIYAADIDGEGRAETIQVIDPATGKVLDSRSISSFKNGIWLTWQVRGNVELKFIGTAGPNPIVNGIFFDS